MPAVLCLLAMFAAVVIAGCGGTGLGLTGGSIPIGAASLQGRAVRADDISRPVPGATVILSAGSASARTVTDSQGRFTIDHIAGGTYLCTIVATHGENVRPWSYTLQFGEGQVAQLIAAMLPANTDPSAIANVRIQPGESTLKVGDTLRFTAQAIDRNGRVLSVSGSIMLVGDIGDLGVDGSLTAKKVGSARLVAWAGDKISVITVRVVP